MKKATLFRLGALALIVCIAMALLLSGTLARYTSTVTGDSTATVADWQFEANDQESAFSFTMNGTGSDNSIAPGDSGTFELKLDNAGDVPADYDIRFTALPDDDANFTFKLTDAEGTEIDSTKKITGSILADGTETITIYWAYADITAPTAAATVAQTVTITATGTQGVATETASATVSAIA